MFTFLIPIIHFNPFMVMIACIGLGIMAFTDKRTVVYILSLRLIGSTLAVTISTAIFGFHFQTNIGLLSTICAVGFGVAFMYINLIA